MTIAKQIQNRQADVQHPLVYRRTYVPFASAPCAPGCRGGAPPRSFPGFYRARETGPPEATEKENDPVKGDGAEPYAVFGGAVKRVAAVKDIVPPLDFPDGSGLKSEKNPSVR